MLFGSQRRYELRAEMCFYGGVIVIAQNECTNSEQDYIILLTIGDAGSRHKAIALCREPAYGSFYLMYYTGIVVDVIWPSLTYLLICDICLMY